MSGKTRVQDVIVPEVYVPYVIQRTKELSAFFDSGVIGEAGAQLGGNLNSGGNTINMPFWNDLVGDVQLLSDTAALQINRITASRDVAVLHFRGNAWSVNDLARQLSGDDPMGAIAELVASWWSRVMQRTLLASLQGAFSSTGMAGNVHNIGAAAGDAANITGRTFLDAAQRLGDAKDQLAAIAMHSAVQTALAKQDLIVTQRDSDGRVLFDTFMGKRIIIDDGMPFDANVYTTYIFGAGAIGYEEGGTLAPTETDRDILAGDDFLTSRRAYVLHPRGIKWVGTVAGQTPSDVELRAATSWERVFENKAIRIVQFRHRIAA